MTFDDSVADATDADADADADAGAVVVAVGAGEVMLVLATTELYCCISITAASNKT